VKTHKPFDLIIASAMFITPTVRNAIPIAVVRNVNPEILYLWFDLIGRIKIKFLDILKLPFSFISFLFRILLVIKGWKKADYIFCVGSLQYKWMKKWFPCWSGKLRYYFNSLSKNDQINLAKIRQDRAKMKKDAKDGIQFIWIGRWVYHKGPDILLNFISKRAKLYLQDKFTIAGCGGQCEGECPQQLIKSGRLKVIPSFSRNELYSLLAEHDVGLFTSRVEGWGLSLNEMLESGMPVFATLTGGVPDLQPYFKKMLKPFPPPPELTLDTLPKCELTDDYYKTFNWIHVAKIYETLGK